MAPFSTKRPDTERHVPDVIILRGMDEVEYDDLPGAEEIPLGALVERRNEQFQLQSTDGASVSPFVAVTKRELGHLPVPQSFPTELADPIQHDRYPAGDTVFVGKLDKGHQAFVLLADGNTVADGDPLFPDGTGAFRAGDFDGTAPDDNRGDAVFRAIEDYDNSGETDGADHIRAEVTL